MVAVESLLEGLAPFNSSDIAVGIAALQLCPENADFLFQLEGAATVACALKPKTNAPHMSASRWRRLFAQELGVIAYANDPHTGPFVEEVAFTGGTYRVFGGSIDDSVFRLRRALDAVFRVSGPAIPAQILGQAERLVGTTLTLLDDTIQRAGLSRLTEAGQRFGAEVVVPDGERFRQLKQAVVFPFAGATALDPAAAAVIEPLTIDQGTITIQELDPPHLIDGPMKTRPFLRTNGELILANPGVVLGSLVHAVVNLLIANGMREQLAQRFTSSVYQSVAASLRRLRLVEETSTEIRLGTTKTVSARWRADLDHVCHVLIAADNFDAYDTSDPYARWAIPGDIDAIRAACRGFEDDLRKTEPTTKVLHLLVTETLGRSLILGLDSDLGSNGNRDLLITAGDLEVLSWLRYGDSQLLLNYSEAYDAFTRNTKVMTYGALDLFREWRAHHDSFYFGDDRKPTMLTVTPSVGAAELRREVHRKRMIHGAPWIDRGALVEVQRADLGSSAPIFASDRRDQIALLVEVPNPIWVTSEVPDNPESAHIAYLMVDAVAYWLWQVSRRSAGKAVLGRLPERFIVRVDVDSPDTWNESAMRNEGEDEPCTATANADGVQLRVPRATAREFNRSDNAGERQLLTALLRGVNAFLATPGADLARLKRDEKALQRLVEEAAPLGPKKKIVLLSLDSDSIDLRDSPDLPSHRSVQDATVSAILDEIGVYLRTVRGLPEGPIADSDRTSVLRDVVSFLYERLRTEVGQLSTDALEGLVRPHERTLLEQATQKLMVATRLACFSEFPEIVAKAQEEQPALSRLALSQRFVIEYMTATPPTGKLRLTTSRVDLITALALEIINYAMVSDAIHFQLSDGKLGMLPSGRLGISPDASYQSAQSRFMAESSASAVEEEVEHFPGRWGDGAEPSSELKQRGKLVDAAAAAEFGVTFTELKTLTHALIEIAGDDSVVVIKEEELISKVAALVDWASSRVGSLLGDLTLDARADFLKPEEPFSLRDVQPWLFNRRLSYIRKPLLRRKQGGANEIVYGMRHVGHAGPYLMSLCTSARLTDVRSKAMKSFIDHVRRMDTKAFNTRVADRFRSDPKLVVDQNVEDVLGGRVARTNGEPLGDLDVLVIDERRRRILVIETKDLGVTRNPREMDNQLRHIFDTRGPEASDATRHVERIAWVAAHVDVILERYGIKNRNVSEWAVEGMFVVDQDLMTPYLADVPMPVVSLRQLVRGQAVQTKEGKRR